MVSSRFAIPFMSTGVLTIFSKTVAAIFIVSLLSEDSFSHGQELVDSYKGHDSNGKFGWDISISGDRSIIAAGAPYGNNAGYVIIFGKSDTDWEVLQQINGTNDDEKFGSSIGLSHDGSILCIVSEGSKIGCYGLLSNKTFYDLLDSWIFNGASNVAVSPNGKVAGITSKTGNGRARIFERSSNGRFLPKGQIINALGFEGGISLNSDGSILIVGDTSSSSVRVYQYNDNRWVIMGNEIKDDSGFDDFGCCVSITHDGLTVSIGAPGNYENEGLVRVHYYNETEQTWIISGDDLLGDNNGDGFSRSSLSANGKYLVAGTYAGNYLKIFERNGVNYQPLGEKFTRELESFGWSANVSTDGSAVIVGFPAFGSGMGKRYLFLSDILRPTPSPSPFFSVSSSLLPTTTASKIQKPANIPLVTPYQSVAPSLVPTTTAFKVPFDLTFVRGETVADFTGDSPGDEIIMKTLISKENQRDSFEQKIVIGAECQFNLSLEYPDIIPPVTVSNDQSLDEDWRGDTIKITTEIDVDTENIATTGIHSSDQKNKSIYSEYLDPNDGRLKAKITFCVRTDYGRIDIVGGTGESSIAFNRVKVTIRFPLEYGFTSAVVSIEEESYTEQVSMITAPSFSPSFVPSTVPSEYPSLSPSQRPSFSVNLEACVCPVDAASKTDCTDSTKHDQNDILNVCVYDPNSNAIITAFKDVSLGNGEVNTQVVNSTGKPFYFASVNKLNEEMAMINTRIASAFFDVVDASTGSPMPINVSGTAVIGWKTGNRKVTAIGTRGADSMRKLQDSDVARRERSFDIKVLLSDGGLLDGSPGLAQVSEYGKLLVVLMMISTSLSGLLE